MIIIHSSWWFLLFVIGDIFSREVDSACQKLGYDFDGVVSPNQSICITIASSGDFVHINVTKNSKSHINKYLSTNTGVLYAHSFVCNNESLEVMKFEIEDEEYMEFGIFLPWFTANKNCTPDNVEILRMIFESDSESVYFSVKNLLTAHSNNGEYEDETTLTSVDVEKDIRKPRSEQETMIAKQPGFNTSEENAETRKHTYTTLLITIKIGILLMGVLCYMNYLEYKSDSHQHEREVRIITIKLSRRGEETNLVFLDDDDFEQLLNFNPSDNPGDRIGFVAVYHDNITSQDMVLFWALFG